jgi:RND family efflux transporter MFP subunit
LIPILNAEGMHVASKKQIVFPIIALAIGVGGFVSAMAMKKPPEEKVVEVITPFVTVDDVAMLPMRLKVSSQGIVAARYETRVVAQVGGEIVELSSRFVRGGFVKKGELLARIDPSDYQVSLIEAQANHAQALASLELEQAQGHVAKSEWESIESTKPSDLSLRRPQLKQELARVKAAQAAVKRAKRNLERTEVVAPYDALIDSRNIGMGSYVGTGSELGKLLSTSLAEVRLPLAANELQYLENDGVGSVVELSASIAGKIAVWSATITRSEGVIDSKSRMTYLVAEVKNPYNENIGRKTLRFGTYVTAKIEGISLPSAMLIPRHLILRDKVAVLSSEDKLHFKKVYIVREQAQDAVITDGIVSGDRIITSALDYPIEGMKLITATSGDITDSKLTMKQE